MVHAGVAIAKITDEDESETDQLMEDLIIMEEKKKTAREIIEGYDGPPVRIMEVCGTHTHEIFRLGIRKLLPEQVELISGPGCPVCVTQVGFIDEAIYLALERQVTICTFGDLVRVPGTNMSLAGAREKVRKSVLSILQ